MKITFLTVFIFEIQRLIKKSINSKLVPKASEFTLFSLVLRKMYRKTFMSFYFWGQIMKYSAFRRYLLTVCICNVNVT